MSPRIVIGARRAPREHAQLHRRQVLRLVDDQVAVRPVGPVEERARLVQEWQVGVAPALAAGRLEEALLVLVEDAVGGGRELLGLRQQAADELLGLRTRPERVERAVRGSRRVRSVASMSSNEW